MLRVKKKWLETPVCLSDKRTLQKLGIISLASCLYFRMYICFLHTTPYFDLLYQIIPQSQCCCSKSRNTVKITQVHLRKTPKRDKDVLKCHMLNLQILASMIYGKKGSWFCSDFKWKKKYFNAFTKMWNILKETTFESFFFSPQRQSYKYVKIF